METHLRAQKKYERTGRVMRVVDERVKKTRAWALLEEDNQQQEAMLTLIRQRAGEHIEGIIDNLAVGQKLNYGQIAEVVIKAAVYEKLDTFTPILPDDTKADPYTVDELMEDAD